MKRERNPEQTLATPTSRPALRTGLVAALLAIAVSGCATDAGLRDEQRLALYRQHAGEPVDSFRYFGRISGWTPLGDRALALWTRPSQVYLLELSGLCSDLQFANAITVTHQSGSVHARFDDVLVLGPNSMRIPCRIQRILPVDAAAVRQAERGMREDVETLERD